MFFQLILIYEVLRKMVRPVGLRVSALLEMKRIWWSCQHLRG